VVFSLQLIKNFFYGNVHSVSSYSQRREDLWLSNWLPETEGFYLDIGSGQPVVGSNSYLFYKRGWQGVLIDPIPRNYLLSKILRRRDQVLKACISDKSAPAKFWEFSPYEYSTLSETQASIVLKNKWAKLIKTHILETVVLRDLNIDISHINASFLTIDTEGLDYIILSTIDWTKFSPRLVCVEGGDSFQDAQIRSLLESNSYALVKDLELSSIYLHTSYTPY